MKPTQDKKKLIIIVALLVISYLVGKTSMYKEMNRRFDRGMIWLTEQDMNRCWTSKTGDWKKGIYFYNGVCMDNAINDFREDFKAHL